MVETLTPESPTLYVCHGDKRQPQYSRAPVREALRAAGIDYEKVVAAHGSPIPFLRKGSRNGAARAATGGESLPALKLPGWHGLHALPRDLRLDLNSRSKAAPHAALPRSVHVPTGGPCMHGPSVGACANGRRVACDASRTDRSGGPLCRGLSEKDHDVLH